MHPSLFESHPLAAHVLYRVARDEWRMRNGPTRAAALVPGALVPGALVPDALVNVEDRD
jgi:hypothetical protein